MFGWIKRWFTASPMTPTGDGSPVGSPTIAGPGGEAGNAGDAGSPVTLPIDTVIDLHAFRPRDVREVVDAYLAAAREAGYTEVRIIHGRGRGVQRRLVRSLLAGHPAVQDFRDAGHDRGGWGATIVDLAPQEPVRPNDRSNGPEV